MAEATIGDAPLDVNGQSEFPVDLLGQNVLPLDEDADAATEVGDYVANGGDDAIQAYAKLEFADGFSYYIQTLELVLGRKTGGDASGTASDAGGEGGVDVHLGATKAISRKHAKLFYSYETQQFEMQVLGKNGVFVNNAFFDKDAMIPLINGTEIRIGEVAFSFLLPRTEGDDEVQGMDPSGDVETGLSDGAQGSFNETMQDVDGVMAIDPTFDSNFPDMEAVAKSIGLTTEQSQTPQSHTSAHDHSVAAAAQYTASAANNKDAKPPFTYASLIAQAVNTAPDRKVTLNGIYDYIQGNYPYYANLPEWQSVQNSIRHNLSLNKAFIKVPRMDNEPGKGAFWTIDPAYDNQFENGVYKKSRRSTVKKGSSFASGGHSDSHTSSHANGKSSASAQANGAQKPTNASSTAASAETNPHLPFSLGPQGQLLLNPVLLRHLSSLTLDQLQQLQSMQAAEAIKWLEKHLEPEGGLVAALAKAMAAAAAETQGNMPVSADSKNTSKTDDAAPAAVSLEPKVPSPPLSTTHGDDTTHPAKRIKTEDVTVDNKSLPKVDHSSEVSSDGTPDMSENVETKPAIQSMADVGQTAGKTELETSAPVPDTPQASVPQNEEDEDEELVVDVLGDDDTHPATLPLVHSMPDIDVNGDDDVQAELEKRVGSGGKGRGGKGKGKSIPQASAGGKGKGKSVPGRASGGKKIPPESLLPATLSGIGGRPIRPIVTTRKRKMAAEEDEDGYVDIDGD